MTASALRTPLAALCSLICALAAGWLLAQTGHASPGAQLAYTELALVTALIPLAVLVIFGAVYETGYFLGAHLPGTLRGWSGARRTLKHLLRFYAGVVVPHINPQSSILLLSMRDGAFRAHAGLVGVAFAICVIAALRKLCASWLTGTPMEPAVEPVAILAGLLAGAGTAWLIGRLPRALAAARFSGHADAAGMGHVLQHGVVSLVLVLLVYALRLSGSSLFPPTWLASPGDALLVMPVLSGAALAGFCLPLWYWREQAPAHRTLWLFVAARSRERLRASQHLLASLADVWHDGPIVTVFDAADRLAGEQLHAAVALGRERSLYAQDALQLDEWERCQPPAKHWLASPQRELHVPRVQFSLVAQRCLREGDAAIALLDDDSEATDWARRFDSRPSVLALLAPVSGSSQIRPGSTSILSVSDTATLSTWQAVLPQALAVPDIQKFTPSAHYPRELWLLLTAQFLEFFSLFAVQTLFSPAESDDFFGIMQASLQIQIAIGALMGIAGGYVIAITGQTKRCAVLGASIHALGAGLSCLPNDSLSVLGYAAILVGGGLLRPALASALAGLYRDEDNRSPGAVFPLMFAAMILAIIGASQLGVLARGGLLGASEQVSTIAVYTIASLAAAASLLCMLGVFRKHDFDLAPQWQNKRLTSTAGIPYIYAICSTTLLWIFINDSLRWLSAPVLLAAVIGSLALLRFGRVEAVADRHKASIVQSALLMHCLYWAVLHHLQEAQSLSQLPSFIQAQGNPSWHHFLQVAFAVGTALFLARPQNGRTKLNAINGTCVGVGLITADAALLLIGSYLGTMPEMPSWLYAVIAALLAIAEVLIVPLGMAMIAQLAPVRWIAPCMGYWLAAPVIGQAAAAWVARDPGSGVTTSLPVGILSVLALIWLVIALLSDPPPERLRGRRRSAAKSSLPR